MDGNRKLSKEEFYEGLKSFNVTLNKVELDSVVTLLDVNKDGIVDFDEFLVGIRGKPNPKRQAMIDKAFLKFDRDGSGLIAAADLKGVYNCSFHPEVKAGKKTEDQVFLEFLKSFGDKNFDGNITKLEWNDYYAAVSSSIDNDDHFVELMKVAWKLE